MKRKPGRPRRDPERALSVAVHVRLAPSQYDALWRRAQQSERTLSAVIRGLLSPKNHLPS